MIKKLILLLFVSLQLNAANETKVAKEQNSTSIEEMTTIKQDIDDELNDSIWITSYENYRVYNQLKDKEIKAEESIFRLEKKSSLTKEQEDKLGKLKIEQEETTQKLKLLGAYTQDPLEKLVAPSQIGNAPKVTNPFSIFTAISFLENIKNEQDDYQKKYKSLSNTVTNLSHKQQLLRDMIQAYPDNDVLKKDLAITNKLLSTIEPYIEKSRTTQQIFDKKVSEITSKLNQDIKEESKKAIWVTITISALFAMLLLAKRLVRKYIVETKKIYKTNKILNILFVVITIFILLFSYIQNAGYLATILGFASAGIAIAMREWFMSIIGWLAIFFGGSIKVGDRIRVVKDSTEYVGDIVNISPLKITLYEDITLATYTTNRRAGRVIFIPNNYIFTTMISSYTHEDLDTVWDGIDFMVTFDSDINRASAIAKEVALKYTAKHSDSTKKQLNKLRMVYNLRNMDLEPRVFTLLGEYGMKISVWYYAHSFSILRIQSLISAEIVSRIKEEKDITIAYPTQHITLNNKV